MFRLLIAPLLAFAAAVAGAPLAPAQDPAAPAPATAPEQEPAVTTETLEQLVSTLQDPVARERLVDQLQALLQAQQAAAPEPRSSALVQQFSTFFRSLTAEFGDTAVQLVDQLARLPQHVRGFWARLQDPDERGAILEDFLALAGIFVAAALVAILSWLLLRRWRRSSGSGTTRRHRTTIRILHAFARLLLAALPAVVLVAVTLAGISVLRPTPSGTAILLALVSAIACKRVASAVVAALFAPEQPLLRLLPFDDDHASRMARSIDRVLATGIYGFFAIQAIAAAGADEALLSPLRSLYGLALLASGIFVVMRYRNVRFDTAEAKPAAASAWQRALHSLASLWWIAAIVYLVGLYAVWVSHVAGGFVFIARATALTVLVLAATGFALFASRWVTTHLEIGARHLTSRLPLLEQRVPRYFEVARAALRVLVWVLAAGFLLEVWGLGAMALLASPALREIAAALLGVLLIVLTAALVIDLATALTQNYLVRSEERGAATAKVRTLVPLANKTIKFVVMVLAAITVLSQLGVEIAPILAGVGVLGLAIGFGAQTLVKDVITGAFILIEDSVSVGDVVNISGTGGVVEAINIRTIRLRDLSGNVHTIPFSTVGTVTNMTKDFSCYLIEAGVAYREDVDEVIRILQQLGKEMQEDPVLGPDVIKPIEIMGLDRFEDSAVIVRARLFTKPIRQWAVGREFNRRMKLAFDAHGIEIPFPHRTIYIGEDKQGKSPPLYVSRTNGHEGDGGGQHGDAQDSGGSATAVPGTRGQDERRDG